MSESRGTLCLVFHGHLPYVLHHGVHPHGENWLYEAAAETYLPLLDVIAGVAAGGGKAALTVGLTPVLLEQLCHDHFKAGFVAYLRERIERAGRDRAEFAGRGGKHFARLAARWEEWYGRALDHFERIGRDIPRQFADWCRAGHVQLLTSTATHAYTPLLLNDQSIRAQFACGTATSRRRLGLDCRGMWLPECAYRPAWEHWVPSVLYGDARYRPGLEKFIAAAGVEHFFVDTPLVRDAWPLGTMRDGMFEPVDAAIARADARRAWGNPLDPVGVASEPGPPDCYAFARHPRVSERVWSGKIGYPAAGEYLEFHHKHGEAGLRYHRITDIALPLSQKLAYQASLTEPKILADAAHFCALVRDLLRQFRDETGRAGVCVAPFDAELFGHWWFEGPRFLRAVIDGLAGDPEVELLTAEGALDCHPPDKVARMPEGSWGENGNHSVWINDRSRWMWEVEYRAENRMAELARELPWRANKAVEALLRSAGRELLLLQASDWPFVVHSGGAVDYGIQRFGGHATRFDRVCNVATELAKGNEPGPLARVQVAEADMHDDVFSEIEVGWWA